MDKRKYEASVFAAFLSEAPAFLGERVTNWTQPADDPPDILCDTESGNRVGIELGTWLHEDQMRIEKKRESIEESYRVPIGRQPSDTFNNFKFAWLNDRKPIRLRTADSAVFREELLSLATEIDQRWTSRSDSQSPQGYDHSDFSGCPMLSKYLGSITFFPVTAGRDSGGIWEKPWFMFRARGGAYSPDPMLEALVTILAKKIEKYESKPPGMSEFHLLIHYDQAWQYNTPVETPSFSFMDAAKFAAQSVETDRGIFDKIFLYVGIQGSESVFQIAP